MDNLINEILAQISASLHKNRHATPVAASKGSAPFILGVTGVIGSGKSTFCKKLRDEKGFHWIETDLITRELYKVGQAGYIKIRDYFGPLFVGPKEVYRGRLRRLVLASQQKLWILNKLMHPLILHEVNKKIDQLKKSSTTFSYGKKVVLDKKRLLIAIEGIYFEPNDLGKFIDKLVVIDAPDREIIARLKKRKIPLNQLRKLIAFQRKIFKFSRNISF